MDAKTLTSRQIADLKTEAGEAGDHQMVDTCERALGGCPIARQAVADAIAAAAAMIDDTKTYIKRANGDCWTGEEWVNLHTVPGAKDACDFGSFAVAAAHLDAQLASDTEGQFADARVVTIPGN